MRARGKAIGVTKGLARIAPRYSSWVGLAWVGLGGVGLAWVGLGYYEAKSGLAEPRDEGSSSDPKGVDRKEKRCNEVFLGRARGYKMGARVILGRSGVVTDRALWLIFGQRLNCSPVRRTRRTH